MGNEKIKGIKCLLKSGDTQAIIKFATNARDTEVWVLAGNFLQNQNWHNDPDIMKTIIQFYTKAKAFESLANFYDACAQVEIDEYRDYEKALNAMKEAKRQLDKSAAVNKDVKQNMLLRRIKYLESYCEAREAFNNGNYEQMARICDSLVDQPSVEEAVRLGDVFANLIEFHMNKGDVQQSYSYLQKMQKKKIVIDPYLDRKMVEDIYRGMGMPNPNKQHGDGSDDIDEDINEEF